VVLVPNVLVEEVDSLLQILRQPKCVHALVQVRHLLPEQILRRTEVVNAHAHFSEDEGHDDRAEHNGNARHHPLFLALQLQALSHDEHHGLVERVKVPLVVQIERFDLRDESAVVNDEFSILSQRLHKRFVSKLLVDLRRANIMLV